MNYFDHAATTQMCEEAILAYSEAARQCFGNASSLHEIGCAASQVLQHCRSATADYFAVKQESVIFTSGGTESNILGIETLLHNAIKERKQIICSSLEHSSIHNLLPQLEQKGYVIKYVNHLEDGTVCMQHLQQLVNEQTALVIVQHGNSEIGTIQPIESISHILDKRPIFLHVDCVQTFGKIDCQKIGQYADSISVSSHKIYGPKGVGALIFPKRSDLQPLNQLTTHERGFRAGTVNIPGIYSFITAARHCMKDREEDLEKIAALRSTIITELNRLDCRYQMIEGKSGQLPHILCLLFSNVQGQYVMMELNKRGFYVSSGSACQSGSKEPSKALLAIGKDEDTAKSSIRISLGKHNTKEQCLHLALEITRIISAFD